MHLINTRLQHLMLQNLKQSNPVRWLYLKILLSSQKRIQIITKNAHAYKMHSQKFQYQLTI